ncbi:MAG TPA: sigma-70 family RNA polymerase sigma factor [Baekduia sp.]|uniref:sigma-70 family RNA polymerase sigma factor n=1 Tax=Baekduia sp. TaxID=2600305 RepID=UPI002B8AB39E|nr:sigma-70 family RNA polymerase sigma factor [Baekduia sp.]HMJ32377.1 sigma-70 family RNA polymerase sigma factor [Baekduia sp.]
MEASALSHPVGLGRLTVAGPLLRLRTDDQLVALFRAGHDEAFGTIHDRYRPRLFAYSRQMLGGSSSDAEDVLQDVFLRAYDALRVDGREVLLRAWLYRVAHNRCIDQLRRPTPSPSDIYDLNRGPQQDPMAEAERREDLRRLVEDVRRLPEQQRSALLMREMEGLSYNELADALDVTVPAIKSLLVRARVGLVEAIEARDTGCAEIRTDLAAAFDRGVRSSGRSRKHLRECAGCRDYRAALRHLDKQLNGLAPSAGPLATLAQILGIGGASSGAAAGTGVVGGGGAAAVSTGAATLGSGAAAATAGKVAAVVAAAAVVGGGAATVENVQHQRDAARAAAAAPIVRHVPAGTPAAPDTQRRVDLVVHRTAGARVLTVHGATKAPRTVAALDRLPAESSTGPAVKAPAYEPITGGLEAPDEPAPAAGSGAGPAGTGTSGAAPGDATSGAMAPGAPGTATPGTGATVPGGAPTAPGTGGATAPPSSGTGTAGPSGQVAPTAGAPVAQGAAVPTPAG